MNTPASNSKNVLNSDVELKGTLKFSGEMTFDGKLDGDVNSVVMRGKVNGNVAAKEKIDIKSKTELFGDIRAPKLAIEEGVTFVGKSDVNPNKGGLASPPPRP